MTFQNLISQTHLLSEINTGKKIAKKVVPTVTAFISHRLQNMK